MPKCIFVPLCELISSRKKSRRKPSPAEIIIKPPHTKNCRHLSLSRPIILGLTFFSEPSKKLIEEHHQKCFSFVQSHSPFSSILFAEICFYVLFRERSKHAPIKNVILLMKINFKFRFKLQSNI